MVFEIDHGKDRFVPVGFGLNCPRISDMPSDQVFRAALLAVPEIGLKSNSALTDQDPFSW